MFNNVKVRGIFAVVIMFVMVSLVSIPTLYAAINLSMIAIDVKDYESNGFQSSAIMTQAISQELEQRYEMQNSNHPIIAFMASYSSWVWIPITLLFGIGPIYVAMTIVPELVRRIRMN